MKKFKYYEYLCSLGMKHKYAWKLATQTSKRGRQEYLFLQDAVGQVLHAETKEGYEYWNKIYNLKKFK